MTTPHESQDCIVLADSHGELTWLGFFKLHADALDCATHWMTDRGRDRTEDRAFIVPIIAMLGGHPTEQEAR